LKSGRLDFTLPALLTNLASEGNRLGHIRAGTPGGVGQHLLIYGFLPAVAYLTWRLRSGEQGDRLLWLGLCIPALGLALVDSTKAPVYAIVLLPGLCVLYALAMIHLWRRALASRRVWLRPLALLPVVVVGAVLWQGLTYYYQTDRMAARSVSDFTLVGASIADALPAGSVVAGAERWWWPFQEHPYLSTQNLLLQWDIEQERTGQLPAFAQTAAAQGVEYLLVNDNVRGDVSRQSTELQVQFWEFLGSCASRQQEWADPTYGLIELYVVEPPCRATPQE
jgi:hypothetical protein